MDTYMYIYQYFLHVYTPRGPTHLMSVLQCVAVRCSVLQCVAVCCSALQCVRPNTLDDVEKSSQALSRFLHIKKVLSEIEFF